MGGDHFYFFDDNSYEKLDLKIEVLTALKKGAKSVDESKLFTVTEIRGTELGNQYEGLPDEMRVYLSDMTDFGGLNIFELHSAETKECFVLLN